MILVDEYREAKRGEDVARLRRLLALRALVATGHSQRTIAAALGVSQPAISQQLRQSNALDGIHPETLLDAAAPILKAVAGQHGYSRLAAFGSVARRQAGPTSDIDLIVEAPHGASSFDFVRFAMLIEQVLGRRVDLVSYGGLKQGLDDDISREAVLL